MAQLSFEFRAAPLLCRGARASEAALLGLARRLNEEAKNDPRLLARPVRIVVPTRALRRHVSARVAEALRPAALGIQVQTLNAVAHEILGARPAFEHGGVVERLFALRFAREAPALDALLKNFQDAEEAVAASVSDLLDAAFRAAHEDAALEAVANAPDLAPGERDRASALVRAAARTDAICEAIGVETPSRVLEAAADALARPGATLHARAVIVYGFADATGVTADLLERLASQPGARVILDVAPDPASDEDVDASNSLGVRLRERLRAGTTPERGAPSPTIEVFAADSPDTEALEVARRVAERIDAGGRPERIGIVARDLPARAALLRQHLNALGVPFSAGDVPGPDTPVARWRGLVDLVALGPRYAADGWLDLVGSLAGAPLSPARRGELRLGLRAAGAARLGQVAGLDADRLLGSRDALRLPGGAGLDESRVSTRSLPAATLRAAIAAARACLAWQDGLPDEAPLPEWGARLDALLRDALGLDEAHPACAALSALARFPALPVQLAEVRLAMRELLRGVGAHPLGAAGGGVVLLPARDARGVCFEHLYFLGNTRNAGSPRDAVLTDPVRVALRALIPDLPLRRERFDEDRHLFAWLLSAADGVTLSWSTADARGKGTAVSPLIERMRLAPRGLPTVQVARPPYPSSPPAVCGPVAGAAIAALHGGVPALTPHLHGAIVHTRRGLDGSVATVLGSIREVAAAAGRVVAEKDGAPLAGAGPYLGWIGQMRADTIDPRHAPPFVSTLEDLVRCPWQTLLLRYLRVEPVPDPLATVPQADARVVGNVVHAVMERLVRRGLDRGLPRPSWPSEPELERIAREEALRELSREGVHLPGLAELVAIRVLPYLRSARTAGTDAIAGLEPVVGVEVTRSVEVGGMTVQFRADREDAASVEASFDEAPMTSSVFVDYKTGKPYEGALAALVARGSALQGAAYTHAAPWAQGKYVFLREDGAPHVIVRVTREAVASALQNTVATIYGAIRAGTYFPRVVTDTDSEPRACGRCEVASACVRGDSSDRARVLRQRTDDPNLAALWSLPKERE